MNYLIKITTLMLVCMLGAQAHAEKPPVHEQDPKVVLEKIHDDVVKVLERDKERLAKDNAYMESMLDQLVSPYVDYKAMGALMLGKKHWKGASKEQRASFVKEFRAMLIRIYGKSVSLYDGQKLSFDEFEASKKSKKRGRVHAEVAGLDNKADIDFFVRYRNSDGWKVYDISVQGISMIKNYRSSFKRDLETIGIDGLIKKLAARGNTDKAK